MSSHPPSLTNEKLTGESGRTRMTFEIGPHTSNPIWQHQNVTSGAPKVVASCLAVTFASFLCTTTPPPCRPTPPLVHARSCTFPTCHILPPPPTYAGMMHQEKSSFGNLGTIWNPLRNLAILVGLVESGEILGKRVKIPGNLEKSGAIWRET
jgi:hypothetical protein